jgi:lysophospholipase L1-like esterase
MHTKMQLLAFGSVIIILLLCVTAFSVVMSHSVVGSNNLIKPIRVACVGDSITEGSGYTTKLRSLLGLNYTVANFGVSGSTVSLNSVRPYMDQSKFQAAMEFHPDIVVIMLGTNDANPEISPNETSFETDYTQLISSFEQLDGRQLIWVVKSPPIFANDSSYNNTYLADDVLPQVDTVAQQMSLPTVDVYSAFGNHSDYFMDGVHPDSNGASIIASNVYDAITLPDGSPDETCFGGGYSG